MTKMVLCAIAVAMRGVVESAAGPLSTSGPIRRLAGVALIGTLAFALGSCAHSGRRVALREGRDLGAGGPAALAMPDSLATSGGEAWGILGHDSLVIYRPRGGSAPLFYSRDVLEVRRSGVRISGFTTTDGRHVTYQGTVFRQGDSLRFEPWRRWQGMEGRDAHESFALPLAGVRSLDVEFPDAGRTVLLVTVFALVGTVAWILAAAASLRESVL